MKAILRSFLSRVALLFRRRRFEEDMAEEMRLHLEVLTEEYVANGMMPEEARHAAHRRFGGVAQIEEVCREQHCFTWLEQCLKDAAFAFRSLCRARGYTLTVLTMLILGIGVATFVFELTAWILVFSQPYPQSEQLFFIGYKDKQNSSQYFRSAMHLQAYQEQTRVFSEYAAVTYNTANVVVDGEPTVVSLIGASKDCFRTLGITPVLGRSFLPEEYQAGTDNVVIITDFFWRNHFLADPDVLGRQLVVDQQPCTVVGVLAPGQRFPQSFRGDVYRPINSKVDTFRPFTPAVFIIGRLSPGVSLDQARDALATVKLPTLPSWAASISSAQEPILMRLTDVYKSDSFWVMAIAAALLYSIACLNAMNLMLVRLLGRRRELSIRLALGGTGWQIMRLLTFESMGLALAASVIVLFAARWLFQPLFVLLTGNEAEYANSFWDAPTLGCIAVLTLLAGILVVLIPAWRLMKADINPGLRDGGPTVGEGRGLGRLRASLVIFQAAFAVVLLAGTGLMMRSFEKLHRTNLGFDPIGKIKVMITLPRDYELNPEVRLQHFGRLQERLAAIPGVKAVSFGQDSLLVGSFWGTFQLLMTDGSYRPVDGNFVAADFLTTAGLTLKRGRWLSGKRGEFEIVINDSFAKARFGEEDPIGQSFRLRGWDGIYPTVVGVVGDVKESVRSTPGVRFYLPNWVSPLSISTLLLRLDRDPGKEFAGTVRNIIYDFDPKLIATQVSSISEIVDNGMWAEKYAFNILKGVSVIALVLALVGLFSVVAYTVDSRMREFGVRLALGAQPADLHRLVMKRGLLATGLGIIVGIGVALALTRFMQSLLFETSPYDPSVYAVVALLMIMAAALACWLPARRAARVDPTQLLRAE